MLKDFRSGSCFEQSQKSGNLPEVIKNNGSNSVRTDHDMSENEAKVKIARIHCVEKFGLYGIIAYAIYKGVRLVIGVNDKGNPTISVN